MPNLFTREQELKKMVKKLERKRNLCAFRYLMDCEDNIKDNIDEMMEVIYQTSITNDTCSEGLQIGVNLVIGRLCWKTNIC